MPLLSHLVVNIIGLHLGEEIEAWIGDSCPVVVWPVLGRQSRQQVVDGLRIGGHVQRFQRSAGIAVVIARSGRFVIQFRAAGQCEHQSRGA